MHCFCIEKIEKIEWNFQFYQTIQFYGILLNIQYFASLEFKNFKAFLARRERKNLYNKYRGHIT